MTNSYYKEWLEKNPGYMANYHKTYIRKKPKLYNSERYKEYYEKVKEVKKQKVKEWAAKNKEKINSYSIAYQQKRRAGGKFPRELWEQKKKEIGCCIMCSEKSNLTIDHKIPVSKGGTNDIENLQPLCLICNIKKGNKLEGQ